MKHKRLERLAMFAEVAEQLSFAEAAKNLGVSKGHLSEQVKKLEQNYATPLMVRTTRSIRLTTEGQKALQSFREIAQLLNGFEQNLTRLDGTIRITAPKLFTEIWLSRIMSLFRQRNAGVSFDIDTSYERHNLSQSNFDMAFRATQQLPPSNLVVKKLLDYQHTIAASPEYLKSAPALEKPANLNKHRCLTASEESSWQFTDDSLDIRGDIVCNDNATLKQLALSGEGLIRLPDFYLAKDIKQNRLQAVLENFEASKTSLLLLYPTTTRETSRLREFTSFVCDFFQSPGLNIY